MDESWITKAMAAIISEMSLAVYNAQTGACHLDDAWACVELGCRRLADLADGLEEES